MLTAPAVRQEESTLDSTITEQDLDSTSQQFIQGLRKDVADVENDLSVDGLSESFLSRIFSLFMFRER